MNRTIQKMLRYFVKAARFLMASLLLVIILVLVWEGLSIAFTLHPDEIASNLLAETIGAIAVAVFGWSTLRHFQGSRKKALRNTAFQTAHRMIQWLNGIQYHYLTVVKKEAENDDLSPEHYIGFIHSLIWANEGAKRAIDINDTITSDTFLRLEGDRLLDVFDNTQAAYDLATSFEFLLERLANRDYFGYAYGDFKAEDASKLLVTLFQDLKETAFEEDVKRYKDTLLKMLITLGGERAKIESVFTDVAKCRGRRLPEQVATSTPLLADVKMMSPIAPNATI